MILSRGDRDLWVAFQTHPGSQASSRVEAKDCALLSSNDGYLLETTEWPKGSQASCGVLRKDSGLLSRPCRRRRASSHDDGDISLFLSSCVASVGFLTRYDGDLREPLVRRQGSQVSRRVSRGARHCFRVMVGVSGSRCVEEGLSKSFSGCGRKPCVPSTCAGDLCELLRVSLRNQGYCGVGRGLSGLHQVWCNKRAPSRVEAGTSGFLSISDSDRRVPAEFGQESQASSCVEEWNSACLTSCSWSDRPLDELYMEPAVFSR